MKDLLRKTRELLYDLLPHGLLMKIYFYLSLKRKLDLKNPKSFNEKICWYKLNYCSDNDLVVMCADKYKMREYFDKKGLKQYLVPQIGLWKNGNEIDFGTLPNEFVLKTNHGCHFNIVCTDKTIINKEEIVNKLNGWLKIKYGKLNVEPHYNKIEPLIICEKYIGDLNKNTMDYKLHCFNGKPCYFEVCHSRVIDGDALSSSYDIDWKKLKLYKYEEIEIEKPSCLKEMLNVASVIAADFPYVRIDFYILDNKPLIGELTFSPAGGMDRDLTFESDLKIGNIFNISNIKS